MGAASAQLLELPRARPAQNMLQNPAASTSRSFSWARPQSSMLGYSIVFYV